MHTETDTAVITLKYTEKCIFGDLPEKWTDSK